MPVWSASGRTIVFASNRGGAEGLYERALGGTGDDRLLTKSDMPMLLADWSRDGRHLAYAVGGDIWALPLAGERKPFQVTTTPLFQESAAAFSPDGRWIAYQSDESRGVTRSGEGDVFVQSFPQRDFKQQVTSAGGFTPHWSDDGKELFYAAADGMLMSVPVTPRGSALELGAPKALFRARLASLSIAQPRCSISKDGRFLMRLAATDLSITVIVNWFEQLRGGMAAN
jgi:Tol biopolymer transport system component